MAKFPCIRKGKSLVPTTQDGRDEVNRLSSDAEVMVSVTPARNARQFRLFWALCEVIADNSEIYNTKRKASDALLYFTSNVDIFINHLGQMMVVPKSLAWENMKPEEFEAFFQDAKPVLFKLLGAKTKGDRAAIIEHINTMLDPNYAPSIAPGSTRERERVE